MIDKKNDQQDSSKKAPKKAPKLKPLTKMARSILSGKTSKKNTIFDAKLEKTGESKSASTSSSKSTLSPTKDLPASQLILPIVPLREGMIFPHTESVLTFGRNLSINAIKAATRVNNMVIIATQKKPSVDKPGPNDLYEVATLAIIDRTLKADNQVNVLVHGTARIKIGRFIRTSPYLLGQAIYLQETLIRDEELSAMSTHLQKEFRKSVQMGKPVEFLNFMKLMSGVNEGELTDQIASTLTVKTSQKHKILSTLNVKDRMRLVVDQLSQEKKVLEIEKDVAHKTQAKFDKYMRENVLRERMKTIQKELGDVDDDKEVADDYGKRLKKLQASPEVKTKVKKEIKKLKQLSANNPEAGYLRSWLDTIFELPWGQFSKGNYDLDKASKVLAKNHYGLPKVKDRILEFIAVLQLKQKIAKNKGKSAKNQTVPTILCFVGPPGVGKTSIGKSVAKALGREFIKVSLGGIRDEAEIRGHRRTYVGSMPGRIISGLKQAKTMNPVFMLDEVDKIGNDFRGDPSAALLEALDPEQNHGFEDHYLDLPFDLSQVLFITTANVLNTIPPALLDRLEVIRYSGYTLEEKFHIAKDHLMKKTLEANALNTKQFKISDTSLKTIIGRYTREAGVRDLERNLGTLMRKAARKLVENSKTKSLTVTDKVIKEFLGPEKFDINLTEIEDQVGLATGLAWTSVGGEMLFIEVALTPGKGIVKLTGKLGDVMKESAQAALTYVKANAEKLGIDQKKIAKNNIHVHIPEGAVPKDGPSAGITLTTAIVSAFTNKPVKRNVAMTGEVTLRGRVLRIGGLKEKSIAAHTAGSEIVIIPKENHRDLVEIPASVKKSIKFMPVARVEEVLKIALG
jgi:ATP-dependent Lon protease